MYSFAPLAAIPVNHTGFGLICFAAIVILFMALCTEGWAYMAVISVPAALVCLLAYCVSYVWTNQDPKVYPNVQVTGEFVEFVAEGYNIPVKSGKTTRHVDQHEQYVVYKVDGQRIMMRATLGTTYPERVVLYKN